MSREKKVEEMARTMCRLSGNLKCSECSERCFFKDYAEKAINAGYRKQSEVDYWMDAAANARREILLEIERLALSKIPEDVEVTMLKDTYYIEAIDELMIKYGVTDKNVGCKIEEEKE